MKQVIITVHGVGEAVPGATLDCLKQLLALTPPCGYDNSPLLLKTGRTYKRLVPTAPGAPELAEVNWADLGTSGRHASKIRQIFRLLLLLPAVAVAVLDLDRKWLNSPPVRHGYDLTQRVYRVFLLAVALWAGFPLLLALGTVIKAGWPFGIALAAFAGVTTWGVRRCGLAITLGGAITTLALVGLTIAFQAQWLDARHTAQVGSYVVGSTQLVCVVLLLVLALEVGLNIAVARRDWVRYMTYLGTNYVPMLVLSLLGCCLWAIVLKGLSLAGFDLGNGYGEWSTLVIPHLPYNLMWAEFGMLGATVGIGMLVAVGFAHYVVLSRAARPGGPGAGRAAMAWYRVLLIGMPLLLAVPAAAMLLTTPVGPFSRDIHAALRMGLVGVYTFSALRLAGVLPALAPQVTTALSVVGDIVFYTCRPGTALSIRARCDERLSDLLDHYVNDPGVSSVCVVGHSQGSVIAHQVLMRQPLPPASCAVCLVTMGSPLSTLYEDFLGLQILSPPHVKNWVNLYRDGDYIGGPIPVSPVSQNINLGAGGHTGYWHDKRVLQYFVCVATGLPEMSPRPATAGFS